MMLHQWIKEIHDDLRLTQSLLKPLDQLGKEHCVEELRTDIHAMEAAISVLQRLDHLRGQRKARLQQSLSAIGRNGNHSG